MKRKEVVQLSCCIVFVVGMVLMVTHYSQKDTARRERIKGANKKTLGIVHWVKPNGKFEKVCLAYVVDGFVYKNEYSSFDLGGVELSDGTELQSGDSVLVMYDPAVPRDIMIDLDSWYEFRNRR